MMKCGSSIAGILWKRHNGTVIRLKDPAADKWLYQGGIGLISSRLMAEGVQIALAMGYSVTVSAARLLMATLYAQLLSGQSVHEAIRRARLELLNQKERRAAYNQRIALEDWLLPVVYQNRTVALPLTDAGLLALARSKYDSLRSVTTPSLVHWDLWDGNILEGVTDLIKFPGRATPSTVTRQLFVLGPPKSSEWVRCSTSKLFKV